VSRYPFGNSGCPVIPSRYPSRYPHPVIPVTPLRQSFKDLITIDKKGSVAVFIIGSRRRAKPRELMKQLFALTNREAEIVELMSIGLSREQLSKLTGCSNETLKTHLKHIFAKTKIHSQKQLIAFLEKLPIRF
jgi:DNA-binding CsgD family transcriptional regulator